MFCLIKHIYSFCYLACHPERRAEAGSILQRVILSGGRKPVVEPAGRHEVAGSIKNYSVFRPRSQTRQVSFDPREARISIPLRFTQNDTDEKNASPVCHPERSEAKSNP